MSGRESDIRENWLVVWSLGMFREIAILSVRDAVGIN